MPPDRLGAWLRDFDELLAEHGLRRGAVRPLRRRLCARADRLRVRRGWPRPVPRVPGGRSRGAAPARRLAVGRARRRPGALGAVAADVRRGVAAPVRRGQGGVRPRRRCSTPGARRPRARRRRPARGASARHRRHRAAADPRRGLARRCRAPLHRGREVRGPHDRRRDVPVVPRHPRREGLHPRPGPGPPGGARRLARARPGRPGGAPTPSTSACPARAARPTARPASTWRRTRRRRCTSSTPAGVGRGRTTRSVGCPGGPRWRDPWRGAANRLARGPLGRVAKAAAGVDRRRSLPAFATKTLAEGSRTERPRDTRCLDLGGHVHRPVPAAERRGRDPGAGRCRADRRGDPGRRLLRTHLDHDRPARPRAPDRRPGPSPRSRRTSRAARRSWASSRPASRCCAATSSS